MADAAFAAKRSNMVSNLQMTPWRPDGRDSDADIGRLDRQDDCGRPPFRFCTGEAKRC